MRQIRFLFWNTDQKIDKTIEVLKHVFTTPPLPATTPLPDVLLLGECSAGLPADFLVRYGYEAMPYTLLQNEKQLQQVYVKTQPNLKVTHLTTDGGDDSSPVPGVDPAHRFLGANPKFVPRAVLLKLETGTEATLLACVHLPSRRGGHHTEDSLRGVASRYKTFIAQAAGRPLETFGQRIVVVGDFNMNPFDLGMVEPDGFYALNNRQFVRHTRKFQYVPELMFYNPCWALLSDFTSDQPNQARPSGSHFYAGASPKNLYWHLYDQVVLSERLIDRFDASGLSLVPYKHLQREVEGNVKRHLARYSDHLPLRFTLNLA